MAYEQYKKPKKFGFEYFHQYPKTEKEMKDMRKIKKWWEQGKKKGTSEWKLAYTVMLKRGQIALMPIPVMLIPTEKEKKE